jgi:probable HAF family extracellular repeat protein
LLRKLKRFIMKIIRGFKVRGFILAAAFSAGLGFAPSASAQVHSYLVDLNSKTVTDIGTFGDSTDARGINDAGRVAGSSGTGAVFGGFFHPFITGPDGMGMRDLGNLGGAYSFADGINEAGQVTGSSYTAGDATIHAFITGPNGMGIRDIGTLGGTASRAFGINTAGQVVGYSSPAGDATFHAFITGPNGMGMRDLGTLGGANSGANGINDAGQVAGDVVVQFARTP